MDALKVFDRFLSIDALLINDCLQLVILLIDFLNHFLFDALLALHRGGHLRARRECRVILV